MDAGTQRELADLVAEVRAINLKGIESLDGSLFLRSHVPELLQMIHRGLEILGTLSVPRDEPSNLLTFPHDRSLASQEEMADLDDLCWLAGGELRAALERLQRLLEEPNSWGSLIAVEQCCDRVVQSLTAIEHQVSKILGTKARCKSQAVTQGFLQSRKIVARFQRSLEQAEEEYDDDVLRRVRSAGTSLTILKGSENFSSLSVAHRVLTKKLHRRALEWLRNPTDLVDGRRLLQEVDSLKTFLSEAAWNHETLAQDLEIIDDAIAALAPLEATMALPTQVRVFLDLLLGRDRSLDEQIALQRPTGEVLEALLELRGRLKPSNGIDVLSSWDRESTNPGDEDCENKG